MNIKGKAERTKQFIIEQSAPIFNAKGIAGTTIDDILAATKMAKGGIYGNFENKEAISIASVDFLFGKMQAHLDFCYKNPQFGYFSSIRQLHLCIIK